MQGLPNLKPSCPPRPPSSCHCPSPSQQSRRGWEKKPPIIVATEDQRRLILQPGEGEDGNGNQDEEKAKLLIRLSHKIKNTQYELLH